MSSALRDDCFLHDRDRLPHSEALAILRERTACVVETETVAIDAAAGRVLSAPLTAPHPIPAHSNSAVDGYAFRFVEYDGRAGARLLIAGRAAAGHALEDTLPERSAVRIFTGAAMPEGFDSVVMQEDVEILGQPDSGWVHIPGGLKQGANRRLAGEDVAEGSTLVEAGRALRPQDIATIASAGYGEVSCFAKLRVAIFSTGDELIRPGTPLEHGQVYDSNAAMLKALVANAGGQADDFGVLPDDLDVVKDRLAGAAQSHHLILTSGGASLGAEDHVVNALDALGKRHLWQIAVKPGRPMTFGQIGDTVFVGLPGNPVAVFVCFLIYARPLMRQLGGMAWREPRRFPVKAAFRLERKKTGRREFWRAALVDTPRGLAVDKFERDGSGLITSLVAADGLIDVGEEVEEVREGDPVDFIPFSELGITR